MSISSEVWASFSKYHTKEELQGSRLSPTEAYVQKCDRRPDKGFDLLEHTKNYKNSAMLEVMKGRDNPHDRSNKPVSRHRSIEVESRVAKLNKTQHSFFVKEQPQIDLPNKNTLNKKHLLLKSIIKTQQEQNKFKGSSIYDESFKRLYSGLEKVYMQPIANKQRLVVDDGEVHIDHVRLLKNDFETAKARIPPKLRLRLEGGRHWARTHHKSCSYYNRQLCLDEGNSPANHQHPQKRGQIIGSIRQLLK